MFEILLFVTIVVFLLVLIYYFIKIEGQKTTILFFSFGFIFSFLRELIIGLTYPLYEGKFQIGPVSPMIIFFWVFAFALAYYFVRKVTNSTRFEQNILVKTGLGTILFLALSLLMETTAPKLGWWEWLPEVQTTFTPENTFLGAPIFVFIQWAITGITFLTIFYLLQENLNRTGRLKPKIIFISLIIYIVIIINFIVGNYFIIYSPFIQIQTFYNIQFRLVLLILLEIYVEKRRKNAIFENFFYLILIIFYLNSLIFGISTFFLNPLDLLHDVLFIFITCFYSIIFAIYIYQRTKFIIKLLKKQKTLNSNALLK